MPINGNTLKIIKVPNYSKVYPTLWCLVSLGHARSLSFVASKSILVRGPGDTLPGVWPWWLPESRWNCRQPWRPDTWGKTKMLDKRGASWDKLWKLGLVTQVSKCVETCKVNVSRKAANKNHWNPQFMCCNPWFEASIRFHRWNVAFEHHPTTGNTISPNNSQQGLNTVSDTHIRSYKGSLKYKPQLGNYIIFNV